jgi:flagellar biosynthesis protein FliR
MLRIGGFVADRAAVSDRVPARVKIVMTIALASSDRAARAATGQSVDFLGSGIPLRVQEILIGVAIGMVVQLAFEASRSPARPPR